MLGHSFLFYSLSFSFTEELVGGSVPGYQILCAQGVFLSEPLKFFLKKLIIYFKQNSEVRFQKKIIKQERMREKKILEKFGQLLHLWELMKGRKHAINDDVQVWMRYQ